MVQRAAVQYNVHKSKVIQSGNNTTMTNSLSVGLTDYLEIMQIAGVSELAVPECPPPAKNAASADPCRTGIGERILPARQPLPPELPKPVIIQPLTSETDTTEIPETEPMQTLVFPKELTAKTDLLRWLADKTARCKRCKELAAARIQTVFGSGHPDAELLFLGEAPGADEDKQGEPFVGRAGQLLTDIITKGMKLRREDVYICNILRCRPPGNRNPLPDEAAHCRPFLEKTLEVIQPKFICCLGAVAAKNLLATEKTIGALRGRLLEYNGITVVCTYHPAYLLRNPAAKKDTWADLQILMQAMGLK
ncbi:MAG: uracil-DNA glycosylase [Planctomycetaceae bacterium]|jgi:DNA polymerase|nr:uracil-DNA glycosylase [Planctomycetaceae bacterium]